MARKKIEPESHYENYVVWQGATNPDGSKIWKGTVDDRLIIKSSEDDALNFAMDYLQKSPGQLLIIGVTADGLKEEVWTIKRK